jgi:putative ABC transport system permease protein
MAWREARGSPGKFALALVAMALAAAAASGLRSFTDGFAREEFAQAKAWIAADVSAAYFGPAPSREQVTAVRDLGVEFTTIAEMAASMTSERAADPVSGMVKIVNPSAYPYYGRIELDSRGDARSILDSEEIIASADLLESLRVQVGQAIRIGGIDFPIGGAIAAEPDRFAIPTAPVGRVIISAAAAKRTGLTDFGARGFFRVLLRTPPESDRRALCANLEEIFPDAHVIDFTSRTPETSAASLWIVPILNAIGWSALALGALTIGLAVHFHLLRNLGTIAILRCLGATTSRIASVYLVQVLALASTGIALGGAAGHWSPALFAWISIHFFGIELCRGEGLVFRSGIIVAGLAAAVWATWVPLSYIRHVRAGLILQGGTGKPQRPRFGWPLWAGGIVFATLLLCQLDTSWRSRGYVGLGIIAAFVFGDAAVRAAFLLMLHGVRVKRPWFVRQGIANLIRYGNQSRIAILSLAGVATFLVCILVTIGHLRTYILDSIPFESANLLVLHFDGNRKAQLTTEMSQLPGVEEAPEFVPTAWVALERAGEANLDQLRRLHLRTFIQRDWPATCSNSIPPRVEIVDGRWWTTLDAQPQVAISRDLATLFGVTPGNSMEFFAGNRRLKARVAALVTIPSAQRAWWREIIFNCDTLPNALYSGAIRVSQDGLAAVRRDLHQRFPDLIILELEELVDRTARIAQRELDVLLAIGGIAACISAALLVCILRSMRAFRENEFALMRALGARSWKMMAAIAVEYGAIGGFGGLLGAVAGTAGAWTLLFWGAGIREPALMLSTLLLASGISMGFSGGIAVAASVSLLHQKPLIVLRRK